jgi:Lrp/AsnC family transcriptional regulator, regulator for asnA, asnC and gidA
MSGDCPRTWPSRTVLGTKSCEVVTRLTQCEPVWSNRCALRSDRDGGARRGAVTRARHVDAVDKAIIEALQKNGREAFRRIAVEVGVSEATIRARYARLCEDNILQVTGITNPLGLGFAAQAMVGVRTAGAPEPVADEIAKWDEADYVVVTAGRFDLLVELVCEDRRHLLDVTNRIRALDGVVSTESFLYLELWKQLYDWGARADEAALAEAR